MKVRAISLQEAKELLAGMKHLEWESIRKAHLSVQVQLSAWHLGSTLSTMAKPFVPLATSSGTVMDPSVTPHPLPLGDQPTRPIYTTDDEGLSTDASVVSQHSAQSSHNRGNCGGKKKTISGNPGGLFLPDFLGEGPDGDWGLHVRLAQAMQAEEKCQRHCFLCQSPSHLMWDCPIAKNGQRPLKPRGPAKNKLVMVGAKAKAKPQTKAKALPLPKLPVPQQTPAK